MKRDKTIPSSPRQMWKEGQRRDVCEKSTNYSSELPTKPEITWARWIDEATGSGEVLPHFKM